MEARNFELILVIIVMELIIISFYGISCVNEGNFRQVEKKISNNSNTYAVKSIRSEDGDIIDCVNILKQPAFSHPALKNHKIQMKPSYDPKKRVAESETKQWSRKENDESHHIVISQLWQRKGIKCPNGTIPIRRIRQFNNFSNMRYGRKSPAYYQPMQSNGTDNLMVANHSTAVLIAEGYSYSGAKGDIRVWNPFVETDDEYSTSQVTLRNGPLHAYEQIESGWAVNPSVYGDHQTRLFAYWTADSSHETGCFDHTCPGFVQTNKDIALGAAIHPISKLKGLPAMITIYIYKDFITNNWWLQYGDNINIGYWPPELFKILRYQANLVEWGGEVYSTRVGVHPHTRTAMGSGQFSDPGGYWISSGQILRMRVQENGHELKFPEYVFAWSEEYDCYDQYYVGDYIEDPEFYYGGPGRNWRCP